MTAGRAIVLVLAGVAGGLTGSVAGLASIATYPALLAAGLAPLTAKVTNSVALVCSSVGAVLGSRPELRGQAHLVRPLAIAGLAGGVLGGALLLVTPADSFERVVPWLIAIGAVAMLLRRRLVDEAGGAHHRAGPGLLAAVAAVGVYAGYFGAGAGVMLLALLLHTGGDTLPRSNAVKNAVLGLANGVAAITFAIFGDVRWAYVLPLGLGLLIGGSLGPVVVRRVPGGPLRTVIAVAGLCLAVKLGIDAYV